MRRKTLQALLDAHAQASAGAFGAALTENRQETATLVDQALTSNRETTAAMIDAALVGRRRPSLTVTYDCPRCTAKLPAWHCNNCGWHPEGEPRRSNRS